MIPVDRTVTDRHYRYMMPELECTCETTRTQLSNLEAISKSLERDPDLILRYLSNSLGCQNLKIDNKYYLVGNVDLKRVSPKLFDFIDRFVLCFKCRNPETEFVIDDGVLKRSCRSCGATFLQPSHRINSYIERSLTQSNDKEDINNKNDKNIEDKNSINQKEYLECLSQIRILMQDTEDNSAKICDICKTNQLSISDIFSEYVKPSQLKQLKFLARTESPSSVIGSVVEMLENAQKEEKLHVFLKALSKIGFSSDDFEDYYEMGGVSKKHSPLIKKEFEYFFDSFLTN